MADKSTVLSIILRAVDQSSAKIQAVNSELALLSRPIAASNKAFGELREHLGTLGLDAVKDGFSRVGSAVTDLLGKAALVGGALAAAVAGVLSLVDHFDQLGDTAEKLGTSADFLAAFRFAAERAGAPLEGVDEALQTLTTNMGAAKAGTGKMLKFLNEISPTLARQVTAAHSLEEALGLLADAEAKLPDAARRNKLAAATLGNASLAPLLARGSKGVQELLTEFAGLAGGMGDATEAAGATDDALKRMHASTEGVKAALVAGLSPALTVIIGQMTTWLAGHRDEVRQWAEDIGRKLPGAVDQIVKAIKGAVEWVKGFVEDIGGWKVAALGLAAVIAGPLIASFASLSVALLATPFGQVLLLLTPVVAAIAALVSETEAFEAVAQRLGFKNKKGEAMVPHGGGVSQPAGDEARFQEMMASGRAAAAAEASARAALDANPAVQQSRLLQDQRDALLAFPTVEDPKIKSMREGMDHRARMAALEAQIAQQAAAHPGPQDVNIKLDITGAPKGMRASVTAASGASVDLTTGHQTGVGL